VEAARLPPFFLPVGLSARWISDDIAPTPEAPITSA